VGLFNSYKLFRYSFLFCALLYQLTYASYISTLEGISRQISETWASERPIVLWCNEQKKSEHLNIRHVTRNDLSSVAHKHFPHVLECLLCFITVIHGLRFFICKKACKKHCKQE